MHILRPLGSILMMLVVPPFAFLIGTVAAIVVWLLLDGADLPAWSRLALSLMAVPATPGLWFVVLPILFARQNATGFALPPEVMAWQEEQFRLEEEHGDAFEAVRRQAIERVIGDGRTTSANDVAFTLVAIELGASGGTATLVHRRLDGPADAPTDPDEPPPPLAMYTPITRMTDDAGTRYVVFVGIDELSPTGGRSHVNFVPAPPQRATELRISLSHMAQPDSSLALPGPWEFVAILR